MRLFEVEGRFEDDLVTLLRNLVGRSDSKNAPQILTYPALSNLIQNFGYGQIDQALFKQVYDKSDELQRLVQDPAEDPEKIVLKTEDEREKQQLTATPGPDIDAMAKSAANKYQKDIH